MPKTDKRVDAYIANAADFAKPILQAVRETVHEACPDCEETIKWGRPGFTHNGLLLMLSAFKEHAAVGFWKERQVLGGDFREDKEGAGSFGRLTKLSDLPSKKKMVAYIKRAVELNAGEPAPRVPKKAAAKPKAELPTPDYFVAALRKNKKAQAAFEKFPPSHRREYLEWITEAKTDATRERRMAQAIEWMAEGKQRNWKYQ